MLGSRSQTQKRRQFVRSIYIKFKSRKKVIYAVKSQGSGYSWRVVPGRGDERPPWVLITFYFLIFILVHCLKRH